MRIPSLPPHQPSHPPHGPGSVCDVPTDNASQLGHLSDMLRGAIRNYEQHRDAVTLETAMQAGQALYVFLDAKPALPDSSQQQADTLYSAMQKTVDPGTPLLNKSLDQCCQAYSGSAADCQAMVTALLALPSTATGAQDPFDMDQDLYLTLCATDDKTLPFNERTWSRLQYQIDELRDDVDALHHALLRNPPDRGNINDLALDCREVTQNINSLLETSDKDGYLHNLYNFLNTPITPGDTTTSLLSLAQHNADGFLAALKAMGVGNPAAKQEDDLRYLLDTVRKYEFQETDVPSYI